MVHVCHCVNGFYLIPKKGQLQMKEKYFYNYRAKLVQIKKKKGQRRWKAFFADGYWYKWECNAKPKVEYPLTAYF